MWEKIDGLIFAITITNEISLPLFLQHGIFLNYYLPPVVSHCAWPPITSIRKKKLTEIKDVMEDPQRSASPD